MISLLRNAMSYVHFLVVNFKLVLLKVTILNFSFLELFGPFANALFGGDSLCLFVGACIL